MELKYGNRKVTAVDGYLVVGKRKLKVSDILRPYNEHGLESYLLMDHEHIEFAGGITKLIEALATTERGTDTYRKICRWTSKYGEAI